MHPAPTFFDFLDCTFFGCFPFPVSGSSSDDMTTTLRFFPYVTGGEHHHNQWLRIPESTLGTSFSLSLSRSSRPSALKWYSLTGSSDCARLLSMKSPSSSSSLKLPTEPYPSEENRQFEKPGRPSWRSFSVNTFLFVSLICFDLVKSSQHLQIQRQLVLVQEPIWHVWLPFHVPGLDRWPHGH
jgi:hypothetical protein